MKFALSRPLGKRNIDIDFDFSSIYIYSPRRVYAEYVLHAVLIYAVLNYLIAEWIKQLLVMRRKAAKQREIAPWMKT